VLAPATFCGSGPLPSRTSAALRLHYAVLRFHIVNAIAFLTQPWRIVSRTRLPCTKPESVHRIPTVPIGRIRNAPHVPRRFLLLAITMSSVGALSCRFLRDAAHPVALSLGLDRLPEHVPTIVASFAFFLFLHNVLSPTLSVRLFPDAFGKASRKAQNNWYVAAQDRLPFSLMLSE
jgi:hypothetical protein